MAVSKYLTKQIQLMSSKKELHKPKPKITGDDKHEETRAGPSPLEQQ